MLHTPSLRIAFGVVALTMLALFYLVTYRSTRSAYSAWWCGALAMFLPGATLYLFNGTEHQVWANPLANSLVVAGAGCVWAGARSLWSDSPRVWYVGVGPLLVGLVSLFDDPAHNIWAGGPVFLAAMWVTLGFAARELWRQQWAHRPGPPSDGTTYQLALRSMTAGCILVSIYYACRWVVFLAVGWEHPLFATYFGGQSTTLISTVLLAVVSFSMSTLSTEQETELLRDRATLDGLTGLLNRSEFLRLAAEETRRMRAHGIQGQLILADLDHFKQINDQQGHLAGDRAIATFAEACRQAVRTTDLVGRYGGEEFILLLPGATPNRATRVTEAIDAAMRAAAEREDVQLPTVSYGIATTEDGVDLERTVGRADAALYRAKAAGRNRSVHYFPGVA